MAIHPANGQFQGPTLGITGIAVSGFKSLAKRVDLKIRPLTVLAGANSSGKSALMQPLLLMKQTLESSVTPAGAFLLSGTYTQYTEANQFLSRSSVLGESSRSLVLEFGFDEGLSVGMVYSAEPDTGLSVVETWGSDAVKDTSWRLAKTLTEEELRSMLLELGSIPNLMAQVGFTQMSVQSSGLYQSVIYSAPEYEGRRRSESYFMHESLDLESHIRRLLFVPGLRGDQNRKWLVTEVDSGGMYWGPFESYVPSIIESWRAPGYLSKRTELVEELRELDLAIDIKPVRLNESELELHIPRARKSSGEDWVNIADVGLAVSTVLPVLVALIQADPGQLVYLEHPELNLHPRAQLKLAQLLVQAANRGVRLVIETHSSLLLQGIMTQVAKGEISRENVALHWFARDEEGITKVTTADIDAEGRYGDWPSDFDDVELKATNAYLDAVETKLMERKGAA